MQIYLLSVQELLEAELDSAWYREALEQVDTDRREKIQRLSQPVSKKLSLGAGLLLQYALRQYEREQESFRQPERLQVTDVLKKLRQHTEKRPLPVSLWYGTKGKPYITGNPCYFNLSHSGEYVLCAIGDREVGVDLQQMENRDFAVLMRRFFTNREVQWLQGFSTQEQQKTAFYTLWTRKEAYGKYLGEGLTGGLLVDMTETPTDTRWMEWEYPEGYRLAVCGERRNESCGKESEEH